MFDKKADYKRRTIPIFFYYYDCAGGILCCHLNPIHHQWHVFGSFFFLALLGHISPMDKKPYDMLLDHSPVLTFVKIKPRYTQYLLIRNPVKFRLVPFLNFPLFLYHFCFLIFWLYTVSVSYFSEKF